MLDKIFRPNTIAVIGASNRKGSVGFSLMKNIRNENFTGKIYPVNWKHKEIQGLKSYPDVLSIPDHIDLVVIATPAKCIPEIVKQCGEKRVGGLVILSAGFKETGENGKALFEEIKALIEKYKIRTIGPNCIGFIDPERGVNASFLTRPVLPGKLAFISQSGALCASILDWAYDQSVGFSHFVSIGSMIDVDFADLIQYFNEDDRTSCILIYMESLSNAEKFLAAAKRFSLHKPIIILKAGKSVAGAKAALSHTGSLAGNDAVYDAAFREAGIIRVNTISQLFHCAQGLAMQDCPTGNRLAIVTNAGGPGILATDHLIEEKGELASLSENTIQKLNKILPSHWSHNNPIDVIGDASAATFKNALQICIDDYNTDAVLAIFTTQSITDPTDAALAIAALTNKQGKPIFACLMGEQDVEEGRELLEEANIPNYRYPESAVDVFIKMVQYQQDQYYLQQISKAAVQNNFNSQKQKAIALLQSVTETGKRQLTEIQSKELLQYYGIPSVPNKIVTNAASAVKEAMTMGFPIVMKIVSPDIGHKTEVKGVHLNIQNAKDCKHVFTTIMTNVKRFRPDARVEGVLIEKMIHKRFELLIGAKKDEVFGPVIVFGMGGTLVGLWKDTNIALAPLNKYSAQRLMENTKAYQLISGFRNRPKVDVEMLRDLLIRLSHLIVDVPEIKEIDINPFAIDEEGGYALDGLIILAKNGNRKSLPKLTNVNVSPSLKA